MYYSSQLFAERQTIGVGNGKSIRHSRVLFAHLLGCGVGIYLCWGEGESFSVVIRHHPVSLGHMKMGDRVLSGQ